MQTAAFPLASWPWDCPSGHRHPPCGHQRPGEAGLLPRAAGRPHMGRHAHVPLPVDLGTRRPVWGQRECFQQHGLMLQPLGSQELSAGG